MKANRRTQRSARELYRLCLVDGVLDEQRVRTVARHLGTSRRRGAIVLLAAFQRLIRLDRDRHTALVESAAPLAIPMRDALRRDVAHLYGSDIETRFAENPALIGGLRVKVGSDVYDGSVRARLDALAARL